MAETRDTYAYFFVRDFDCDTTDITRLLGFNPTESHNKNAPLPSGRPLKSASWKRVSDLPRDTVFVSEHVEALLPLLENHRDSIANAAAKYCAGLQCVGYYTAAHPGFHMDSDLIRRVAALNLSIDFDLYCYCDGECSESIVNSSPPVT